MKTYRILYSRTTTEVMEIPAEEVKRIETYDSCVSVIGTEEQTIAVIPLPGVLGAALLDIQGAPAPPPTTPEEPPGVETTD